MTRHSGVPPSRGGIGDIARLCRFVVVAVLLTGAQARGQGFSPEEAARRMTAAEGFRVTLVAAEPLVRQPVAIDFDDRGRCGSSSTSSTPTRPA